MAKKEPSIQPEPPKILAQLEWLRLNWRKHWGLISVAIFVTLMVLVDWEAQWEKYVQTNSRSQKPTEPIADQTDLASQANEQEPVEEPQESVAPQIEEGTSQETIEEVQRLRDRYREPELLIADAVKKLKADPTPYMAHSEFPAAWPLLRTRTRLYEIINPLYSNRFHDPLEREFFQQIPRPSERTPELFRDIFEKFKETLYFNLDVKEFREMNLHIYLKTLIQIHAHIVTTDYRTVFAEIAENPINEWSCSTEWNPYENIMSNTIGRDFLVYDHKYECYDKYYLMWFYSFWNRRYTEGTFEVSYEILAEIDHHYSEEYRKLLLGAESDSEAR